MLPLLGLVLLAVLERLFDVGRLDVLTVEVPDLRERLARGVSGYSGFLVFGFLVFFASAIAITPASAFETHSRESPWRPRAATRTQAPHSSR